MDCSGAKVKIVVNADGMKTISTLFIPASWRKFRLKNEKISSLQQVLVFVDF